jgi:hypothetical protein
MPVLYVTSFVALCAACAWTARTLRGTAFGSPVLRALRRSQRHEPRALRRVAGASPLELLTSVEHLLHDPTPLSAATARLVHHKLLESSLHGTGDFLAARALRARLGIIEHLAPTPTVLFSLSVTEEGSGRTEVTELRRATARSIALNEASLYSLSPLDAVDLMYEMRPESVIGVPAHWHVGDPMQLMVTLHIIATSVQGHIAAFGELVDLVDSALDMSQSWSLDLLLLCATSSPGVGCPFETFIAELDSLADPMVQSVVGALTRAGSPATASELARIASRHLVAR